MLLRVRVVLIIIVFQIFIYIILTEINTFYSFIINIWVKVINLQNPEKFVGGQGAA